MSLSWCCCHLEAGRDKSWNTPAKADSTQTHIVEHTHTHTVVSNLYSENNTLFWGSHKIDFTLKRVFFLIQKITFSVDALTSVDFGLIEVRSTAITTMATVRRAHHTCSSRYLWEDLDWHSILSSTHRHWCCVEEADGVLFLLFPEK